MFFTKSLLNLCLVINNEIIDLKYKSMISSLVTSGLGLGGMFYVLMYYLLKDWRYVFIVGTCLSAISGVIIKIFYHDSLVQSLINKDFDKFYNDLVYIAKMNGREKEFNNGITNDEKYKKCLEKLKEYTIVESTIKYNKKEEGVSTQVVQIQQNQFNKDSDNIHQSEDNLISTNKTINNKNTKVYKKEIK